MAVSTSSASLGLKETLEEILTDELANVQSKLVYKQWMTSRSMSDAFEDDLEVAGGGLAALVPEGTDIPTAEIKQGYLKRYTARTFGLRMIVTREALEDYKYKEIVQAGRRLNRALWKTLDIDCTQLLVNAESAAHPGGDGVAIASAAHPLAHGGTFSNVLAVPMSPSVAALNLVYAQLAQMVDHDGVVEGFALEKIVYPVQQHFTWCTIMKSSMDPAPGNFAAINAAKVELGSIKLVPNRYWNNTTTNWACITDAPGGPQQRWRAKPKSSTWATEESQLKNYSITARWDNGLTDPRSFFFVGA